MGTDRRGRTCQPDTDSRKWGSWMTEVRRNSLLTARAMRELSGTPLSSTAPGVTSSSAAGERWEGETRRIETKAPSVDPPPPSRWHAFTHASWGC